MDGLERDKVGILETKIFLDQTEESLHNLQESFLAGSGNSSSSLLSQHDRSPNTTPSASRKEKTAATRLVHFYDAQTISKLRLAFFW